MIASWSLASSMATLEWLGALLALYWALSLASRLLSRSRKSGLLIKEAKPPLAQESSNTSTGSAKLHPDLEAFDFSDIQPIDQHFDWTTVPEKPWRPWHDGPYHVTMGIKKTCSNDWVEIDQSYMSRYKYKRQLFAQHPHDTICSRPGSEEASFESLYALVDFLPRRYPTMFTKTEHGIKNLVTNDDWNLDRAADTWKSYHPLQVMGLLSTEDWFIMKTDEDGETTRLVAGANCFPAGWKLRERVGQSLWEIHAGKVPQYEEKLAKSMDRYFLRLRADQAYMRFNYAIDLSSELFHINSHHNLSEENLNHDVTLEQLHLRVERQVLQRLPKSKAIAFSIRTYVTPITDVCKDLTVARALRTSVSSYSEDVAKYKNKALWNDVLMKYLDGILDTPVEE